jgi:hypothetical protein
MKHPCKDLIQSIIKLNDGEKIPPNELKDLRAKLEAFPQCMKYLNLTGRAFLKDN